MLEAMATGLPVFATEHGGIPEAIENGVSGVLVPERDHETLSHALLDAAEDPGFVSRIARSGAEKRFERASLSNGKRSDSKIFIYGRLDTAIDSIANVYFFVQGCVTF